MRVAVALLGVAVGLYVMLLPIDAMETRAFKLNHASPSFKAANAAQISGIAVDAATDLWYQNATIEVYDEELGEYLPLQTYGYWLKRSYDESSGSFQEVQLYYRTAAQIAIQQVNSYIDEQPPRQQTGTPSVVAQSWTVSWATPPTAEGAFLSSLNAKSFAVNKDIVYTNFASPRTEQTLVTQQAQALVGRQRQFVEQVYMADPTGYSLPVRVWTDSYVVDARDIPVAVKAALNAYESGHIPVLPDPLATAMNVYLYVYPGTHDAQEVDRYYVESGDVHWTHYFGQV